MPVIRATSVREVLDVLVREPEATVVAGGTYVLVDVAEGRLDPETLVTLRRVVELGGITHTAGTTRIGATATYAQLLAAPGLGLVTAASRTIGSPAQRNSGTVGGGLVGNPGGDLATALVALDATVETATPLGRHEQPLRDWLHAPRRPGELVCATRYREPGGSAAYLKAGERQAVITATACAAVVLDRDRRVRVAVGGVAGPSVRVGPAEKLATALVSRGLVAGDLEDFASAVRLGLGWAADSPRASAAHRRHVAGVLAARALARALQDEAVAA